MSRTRGHCRKPQRADNIRQPVRNDVFDGFAQLSAPRRLLQDFRSQLGQSQVAGRALEQANAELVLEFGYAATDSRDRHFEAARSLGEAARSVNQELFIFRKDGDGAWRIARYSFSPTNPPAS